MAVSYFDVHACARVREKQGKMQASSKPTSPLCNMTAPRESKEPQYARSRDFVYSNRTPRRVGRHDRSKRNLSARYMRFGVPYHP